MTKKESEISIGPTGREEAVLLYYCTKITGACKPVPVLRVTIECYNTVNLSLELGTYVVSWCGRLAEPVPNLGLDLESAVTERQMLRRFPAWFFDSRVDSAPPEPPVSCVD